MPIGISDDHDELHRVARRWREQYATPAVARAALDAEVDSRPENWPELAALGWLGLHVPEEFGGAGYGLGELAVVLEELGYAGQPGPVGPTVTAAALISAGSVSDVAKEFLPAIAAGETIAAVSTEALPGTRAPDGGIRIAADLAAVVSAHLAEVLVAPVQVDGTEVWVVLTTDAFTATEVKSLDRTRRSARVRVDASVPSERVLAGLDDDAARRVITALALVELVGASQWAVDTAAEYAKVRVQFDRPIGQFQGVKHRCADMLVRTELARAATWDAIRAVAADIASDGRDDTESAGAEFAVRAAAALTIDSAVQTTKDCIQTLGGIGFTWEHDAHMYMKRATTVRQYLGTGAHWKRATAASALSGARRSLQVDLPPEAETIRTEVRAFIDALREQPSHTWNARIAEAGYLSPQWPAPWGRDAGAVEQLVIEQEFRAAKIRRVTLAVGAWALPALMVYGTDAQREQLIPPTMRGDIEWCQLFSEPGSGSDLASLTTKAEKVEGGYLVNGQKVWTSMAQTADWGILLARTDPDKPKHDGISYFVIDMKHTDGITIRPLRELTGNAWFNEVFFDDVFIPDEHLVGQRNDGWRAARTTLANERVFMGSGASMGLGVEGLLALVTAQGLAGDDLVLAEVGGLAAESHGLAVLGFRMTMKALLGADPGGAEASVRKLAGVLHDQLVQEVGLSLLGAAGAVDEGEAAGWIHGFLFNQNLTIAGGTSQIQRNVIAERLLGLPRDP